MMNQGVLQVNGFAKNEDVSIIEPCFNFPESVEITYQRREVVQSNNHLSPVVICMPTPFPYEGTKVLPWKHEITVVDKVFEKCEGKKGLEVMDIDVTNIAGMSRMIRSG